MDWVNEIMAAKEREFGLWCAVAILGLLAFWEFAGLVWALVALRRARRPIQVVAVQAYPVYIPVPYAAEAPPAEATGADEPAPEWDSLNDPDGWKNRPPL